jgi:putative tricarboxylic transport membrane protein
MDPATVGSFLITDVTLQGPGLGEAFGIAISTVTNPINFVLIVLGVLLGMLMGILPGLGGTVTLALLIPLTFGVDPLVAFMLLTAALGGTNFGGSITAILINTPGSSPNAATLLDGYPLTRQGRAGEAIGASAAASAFGALFGILILTASVPFMLQVILLFGPPEVFWLGVWGLTVIAVVVKGSVVAGLISAGFGMLFSIHGVNQFTATVRWDYGFTFMRDGMPLVPALIGLFAVAEMIKLVSEGGSIAKEDVDVRISGGQWKGVRAVYDHKWLFMRSAFIGAVIGVVPGVGGSAANYIAYFQAVQTASDPDVFGTGDIRGVIAPEASNDAKDGTGFLPTLGLGVPGSASMAILLGAFVLHGIQPGPLLFRNELDIVTTIIVSLLISNFLTSAIGIFSANQLIKVTRIDIRVLAPAVLVIAFFGTYALNNNIFQVFIAMFFGIFGFMMVKANMSRIPMILGLVLGIIVEQNFFRTLQISRGEYWIFVGVRRTTEGALYFDSPLAVFLILLTIASLGLPWIRAWLQNRASGLLPG